MNGKCNGEICILLLMKISQNSAIPYVVLCKDTHANYIYNTQAEGVPNLHPEPLEPKEP